MNEERLKELEAFKAKLEIQLNETVFLIQGYKNAMENQQDDVPEQVEKSDPNKKKKPNAQNGRMAMPKRQGAKK